MSIFGVILFAFTLTSCCGGFEWGNDCEAECCAENAEATEAPEAPEAPASTMEEAIEEAEAAIEEATDDGWDDEW